MNNSERAERASAALDTYCTKPRQKVKTWTRLSHPDK